MSPSDWRMIGLLLGGGLLLEITLVLLLWMRSRRQADRSDGSPVRDEVERDA